MATDEVARSAREPAELPARLGERLGYLLALTHGGLRAMGEAEITELGLGIKEYAVLSALSGLDAPPSQQALATLLRIDRTTMVATIDSLEQAGFVARGRDPADRRVHRIETTPAGERVLERAERRVRAIERRFLAPLGAADRRELLRILQVLAREHGRALPPEPPRPRGGPRRRHSRARRH